VFKEVSVALWRNVALQATICGTDVLTLRKSRRQKPSGGVSIDTHQPSRRAEALQYTVLAGNGTRAAEP